MSRLTKQNLDHIKDIFERETGAQLRPERRIRWSQKRVLLAATITILCFLSLTACAVHMLHIREMGILKFDTRSHITTSGLQNSNEFRALAEWQTYMEQNPRQKWSHADPYDRTYSQYGAYTQSHRNTLDSILKKYDLKRYDEWATVYDGDPDSLYDAVGVSGFLPESCANHRGTIDPDIPGCSIRNGVSIFSYSDTTRLPDGTKLKYELSNSAKGYMPIFIGIGIDTDCFSEWEYTSKDGITVLLATDKDSGAVLADFPHSFLTININTDTEENTPPSKSQMEAFADMVSYSLIAQIR